MANSLEIREHLMKNHVDPAQSRLAASLGRVGTAYDTALIASTIGLYKTRVRSMARRPQAARRRISLVDDQDRPDVDLHWMHRPFLIPGAEPGKRVGQSPSVEFA